MFSVGLRQLIVPCHRHDIKRSNAVLSIGDFTQRQKNSKAVTQDLRREGLPLAWLKTLLCQCTFQFVGGVSLAVRNPQSPENA